MSASSSQPDKDAPSEKNKLIARHVLHTLPTEAQQKHEAGQAQRSFKETLINWLPTDANTFLFELVAVIYLVVGILHFSRTGDTSMLTTLLTYVGAFIGLAEVKPLVSWREKKEP
jgi:hypothetical protein